MIKKQPLILVYYTAFHIKKDKRANKSLANKCKKILNYFS